MGLGIRGMLAVAGLLAGLGDCAAKDERAASASGEWDSMQGPPAWSEVAPATSDTVRGVVASQSNLLELAVPADEWVADSIARTIAWRLRPVLGEDADGMLDGGLAGAPVLRRACHLTPPRKGQEMTVGGQTYTVWTRWEIPLEEVLERLPEAGRDAAREALGATEPAGTPDWEEVRAKPAWAEAVPPTEDTWTVVVGEAADRADVSRAQIDGLAESRVASSIVDPLRGLLGGERAWTVGDRATTWRKLTHRAFLAKGERQPAWARFEVPMARILAAVPDEQREAARALLMSAPVK